MFYLPHAYLLFVVSVLNSFSLTVAEQLKFYGTLKGIPTDQLNDEVYETIENFGLTASKDKLASYLSGKFCSKFFVIQLTLCDCNKTVFCTKFLHNTIAGGMKRKLCICIALIGGSKLVILDEPTAGVDAHARRSIWDILIRNKKGLFSASKFLAYSKERFK